ncbi:MAG: L,D-transpeptidase family protein [Proteobacteria bacterium]|nr:L,D-transpeptidase family protein [Pseudomonadota bacterium]MBS0572530.1 L,D-transpeptidase family protein [Pseudomonadota bacterium]
MALTHSRRQRRTRSFAGPSVWSPAGRALFLALALASGLPGGTFAQDVLPAAADAFSAAVADAAGTDAALSGFYRAHGYATLWTGPADAARRGALFAALDRAGDHGLPVSRYDAAGLKARFAHVATEGQRARLEVAVSRAFLAYASDVQTGFLVPADIDPGIVRAVPRRDQRATLDAFAAADPAQFIAGLPPQAPEYAELQRARLALIDAAARGGWGPKIAAKKLKPGDEGEAVVALRDRLVAEGYMPSSVTARFDEQIQAAVQRFQTDNGLNADGVAGEGTIAELNRDPEDRLKSVLVAMERMRWMNGTPLGARHVWVNLPDFTAKIVDDGKVTFQTTTVVGMNQADRRSPEFSDLMQFMVINPKWSVPRSITVKEYLPMLQKNPLAAQQLRITDRQGRTVDRTQVDFTQFTPQNFPFSLSQDPSEANALGLVKFMFPNPWNIYLHDTPQKALFKKETRAFSHGCIRLGEPFGFAYTLLARQSDDPEKLFKSHLSTRRESTLPLARPVPVHLVYFTAWPDAEGRIDYRRDIYGRDARIFEAMQAAGVLLPTVEASGVALPAVQG